ncbi:MAG: hypothetical protein QOE90_3719 [Thermoplasmata archaeon]|jgi:hypothetical protein|nr:hypothetical protein [Thermoplasmata archaeon]
MTHALSVTLGVVAGLAAGALAIRFVAKAPVVRPLPPPPRAQAPRPGPAAAMVQYSTGAKALAARLEPSARDLVAAWLREGHRADALPASLRHLMAGGSADEWARAKRQAAWRGPDFLFPAWSFLAERLERDDARAARWLDEMTRDLIATVEHP